MKDHPSAPAWSICDRCRRYRIGSLTVRRPEPRLVGPSAAGDDVDAICHHERRIEAHTELADKCCAIAALGGDGATLIGQFGVGFYSAFMVADRVDVISRRAGTDEAWLWSSDGKGTYSVSPAAVADAPGRGTRVVLHLMEGAKSYTERFTLERIVKAQSGHVPVPIAIVDKPGAAPSEVADGAALWTKPKFDISAADYTDFYR